MIYERSLFLNNSKTTFIKKIYLKYGKRIFDFIISFILLIFLMPLFLLISVFIKLDSKGPIIYKQKRIGKNLKEFNIYKFRTMGKNADKIGPEYTVAGDSRITKVGSFLRKYSLDELPQLLNVLIGDMSLVGYRPGIKKHYKNKDLNSKIFCMKPGITGYAQIMGRSKITRARKRELEKEYINKVSFYNDLKIILLTLKVVVINNEFTN